MTPTEARWCKWYDGRGFCHSPKTIMVLGRCMPCPNRADYPCPDFIPKDKLKTQK